MGGQLGNPKNKHVNLAETSRATSRVWCLLQTRGINSYFLPQRFCACLLNSILASTGNSYMAPARSLSLSKKKRKLLAYKKVHRQS